MFAWFLEDHNQILPSVFSFNDRKDQLPSLPKQLLSPRLKQSETASWHLLHQLSCWTDARSNVTFKWHNLAQYHQRSAKELQQDLSQLDWINCSELNKQESRVCVLVQSVVNVIHRLWIWLNFCLQSWHKQTVIWNIYNKSLMKMLLSSQHVWCLTAERNSDVSDLKTKVLFWNMWETFFLEDLVETFGQMLSGFWIISLNFCGLIFCWREISENLMEDSDNNHQKHETSVICSWWAETFRTFIFSIIDRCSCLRI